jgi:hypothetical protein
MVVETALLTVVQLETRHIRDRRKLGEEREEEEDNKENNHSQIVAENFPNKPDVVDQGTVAYGGLLCLIHVLRRWGRGGEG